MRRDVGEPRHLVRGIVASLVHGRDQRPVIEDVGRLELYSMRSSSAVCAARRRGLRQRDDKV